MNTQQHPYSTLEPNTILDAIESVGLHCTGGLFALNSYENRVYQIDIEDAPPVIVKFYRPGRWSDACILEEHQFALELTEHEIPVVAPISTNGATLHHYQDFRFAIFPRKSGRALELDNLDQLEWMGRFIGRIHAVGGSKPFQHRIKLNTKTYGDEPYQFLIEHDFVPADIRANYQRVVEAVLALIKQRFAELGAINYIRIHGDMHSGNVLWSEQGPHIVDLDDCLMGPPIQDIWMMLSGTDTHMREQLDRILDGYEQFYEFDWSSRQLIEPLRTLRMLHYSAWIAKRWDDPAFPRCFPTFNTPSYWLQQLENFTDQLALLDLT